MKLLFLLIIYFSLAGCFPARDNACHDFYPAKAPHFEQMLFTSADTGYAISEKRDPNTLKTTHLRVHQTVNGGKNWTKQLEAPGELGELCTDEKSIYFHSSYYTSQRRSDIYQIADNGQWQLRDTYNINTHSIFFKDSLHHYYYEQSSRLFWHSDNRGKKWKPFHRVPYKNTAWHISYKDDIISYFTFSEKEGIMKNPLPPIDMLVQLNTRKEKWRKTRLPDGVEGDCIVKNIITAQKNNQLLIYRLNSDRTFTHLYTFKMGKRLHTHYLDVHGNQIYLSICDFTGAFFMDYYLFYSSDGGLTWERMHPEESWFMGKIATLGDHDGFHMWIYTYLSGIEHIFYPKKKINN